MSYILVGLMVIADVGVLIFAAVTIFRWQTGRTGPQKTVSAQVVDRYISQIMSARTGSSRPVYHVVFQLESGKKMGFTVREISYHGYRIGERGILTYAGDRIIDFH